MSRPAAAAFEQSDTLALSAAGTEIALRLFPRGSAEYRRAALRSRRFGTLSRREADLLWPHGAWKRLIIVLDSAGYLERFEERRVHIDARDRREQDAPRAQLDAAAVHRSLR